MKRSIFALKSIFLLTILMLITISITAQKKGAIAYSKKLMVTMWLFVCQESNRLFSFKPKQYC